MTDVKAALRTDTPQTHTLLPGYQLPAIQLNTPSQHPVNLAKMAADQHLLLIYIVAVPSSQQLKTLLRLTDKHQQTLQALNARAWLCLSDRLPSIPPPLQRSQAVLIDSGHQLLYALQQETAQNTAASSAPLAHFILVKKGGLIYNSSPLLLEQAQQQLREVVDIVRFFN